ncbi:Hypothetical protein PP7435_CHR4-0693 [Komagataella phaffii CBS 7435]|uniref:Uncharacterized protein n=2 Tax=Komagataella phaffii TaxID=460519 RepID=C4R7G8_KOMPG|nr:Hypothetical protein PAS_chr4_0304 [Komagataella phaffii GS115]AOA65331.1 GQ67_04637T0 [Komagataella phaffii]CAH2451083.1 Hypothetical protein BQ9382_C4-3650 [Komagataella phaffii CBS 7435]AOA70083.1 GQ68_04609T0 [Komagataella phaffii GS115]CAY71543.1 Hypothetical protein PAS_chr4_0304 [Komagataella phaffii GS115]CCA40850.1 Hypothetical protein PP7435_CHR4-0693 [Komagataella phaffii CBS 7435]
MRDRYNAYIHNSKPSQVLYQDKLQNDELPFDTIPLNFANYYYSGNALQQLSWETEQDEEDLLNEFQSNASAAAINMRFGKKTKKRNWNDLGTGLFLGELEGSNTKNSNLEDETILETVDKSLFEPTSLKEDSLGQINVPWLSISEPSVSFDDSNSHIINAESEISNPVVQLNVTTPEVSRKPSLGRKRKTTVPSTSTVYETPISRSIR